MRPTADYHQGGLIMYSNDDNYVRLTYGYFGGRSFQFGREINGKFEALHLESPNEESFYLRVSKSGQDFSGYYSEDGSNWTFIGKYTGIKVAIDKVGLAAFSGSGGSPLEIPADFDFFHVICEGDGC